jgi:hypothetical protein
MMASASRAHCVELLTHRDQRDHDLDHRLFAGRFDLNRSLDDRMHLTAYTPGDPTQ